MVNHHFSPPFGMIFITPGKIRGWNLRIQNTPLEEENHLPNHHFQVLC